MIRIKPLQLVLLSCFALAASTFSFGQTTPAPAAETPAPTPTIDQRVAGLEAYLTNGDPTVSLKVGPKDKDGNPTIPAGLTTPSVGVSGPGHNAWMMTSAA